jgi:predicted phage-related endonuclease
MAEPVYRFDIQQGTDEWLALRRGVITASTIGKLLTPTGKAAKNDSARTQLLQLLAERITGESEASYYNDDMARGHLLEPLARDLYSESFDPVVECGFITMDFDGTTIGYSPDGLVGDDGLIEIKAPRPKGHLRSLLSGEVPTEYLPQLMTGLAVTGRRWIDYISYAPGLPLFVQRCERDEELIEPLIMVAQAAEAQLADMLQRYELAAAQFPATEPIRPEQEIVI